MNHSSTNHSCEAVSYSADVSRITRGELVGKEKGTSSRRRGKRGKIHRGDLKRRVTRHAAHGTILVSIQPFFAELQSNQKVDPTKPFLIQVDKMSAQVNKTEEEWKRLLTPEQFQVARKKGTERPFTGAYWNTHEKGIYKCACCGTDLFSSETKFESGTGWPSFWAAIGGTNIRTEVDKSLFMKRTEILCSVCDAHLGHVFEDGPKPTGLRYCVNSASLKFSEAK